MHMIPANALLREGRRAVRQDPGHRQARAAPVCARLRRSRRAGRTSLPTFPSLNDGTGRRTSSAWTDAHLSRPSTGSSPHPDLASAEPRRHIKRRRTLHIIDFPANTPARDAALRFDETNCP